MNNKKADFNYQHILGDLSKVFQTYPHYIVPSHIVSTEKHFNDLESKSNPFKSTYPLPFYTSKIPNQLNDVTKRIVYAKQEYINDLQRLKKLALRYLPKPKKTKKIKNDVVEFDGDKPQQTKYFIEYAELLECDPEPYFNGLVNWYFTGGTMVMVKTDGDREWLCHTSGEDLNYLNISEIFQNESDVSIDQNESIFNNINSSDTNTTIFELNNFQDNSRLMVRRKNTISIFNLNNRQDNGIHLKSTDQIPFISGTLIDDNNLAATIDLNQCLTIWNISANEPLSQQVCTIPKTSKTEDNWSRLQSTNYNHQLYHVNRKNFQIFDSRCKINLNETILQQNFTNLFEQCEQITCINCTSTSNLCYVATTHKLFAIDLRSMKYENLKLLKWNHLMKMPPLYIETKCIDNHDIVCIGGANCTDLRVIETIFNENVMHSIHLPYKPLSIVDSYDIARTYGQCLDPKSCVGGQRYLSNVGICLYNGIDGQNKHLFVQNSAGNIFKSIIHQNKISSPDDDANKISIANCIDNWDKQLMENNEIQSTVTTITNFQSMIDALRFDSIKICEQDNEHESFEEPIPLRPRQIWQKSINELSQYTDVLAKDILSIWDMNDDEDIRPNSVIPNIDETIAKWLDEAELPTTILPSDSMIDTATSIKIDDSLQLPEISINDIEEQLPPTVDLYEMKRVEKKRLKAKRKFVPGF